MTAHQHENIARGIRRIKYSAGLAKNVYKVDVRFWHPPLKGTYLGNRLGNKKVTTTN